MTLVMMNCKISLYLKQLTLTFVLIECVKHVERYGKKGILCSHEWQGVADALEMPVDSFAVLSDSLSIYSLMRAFIA